ncbi:MAG: DUF262 domain-containing protein [Chloroflexi bacterium]|nr:DUF262 domain-containing protein [Chloroflexota bacterium]
MSDLKLENTEKEDALIGVPIYNIVSYPADPTLENLHQKHLREEIIIPKFQRKWVWKHEQASKLIESFLLGLPVPSIFVYKDLSQKQVVIDGQQRLKTIWGFFDGKFENGKVFFLKSVDPRWEGKTYESLDEGDRIRLRDATLRQITVEQVDPNDTTSIYLIFERLNTGGTPLTRQEIRNCKFLGPFNDLVVELNSDSAWRRILGVSKPDIRMRDIELIVRFLALNEGGNQYNKPMWQFLNKFMGQHRDEPNLGRYEQLFLETTEKVSEALGPSPFRIGARINVAVLDSVMVAFARSPSIPANIQDRFQTLKENPSYIEAISQHTTDEDKVENRIKLAQEVLFK